jgi:hypothetical protein
MTWEESSLFHLFPIRISYAAHGRVSGHRECFIIRRKQRNERKRSSLLTRSWQSWQCNEREFLRQRHPVY